MTRKPHPPPKSPAATAIVVTGKVADAQMHLEKGRYRDAIECFKALLKLERRPEWLSALADAYAGRAQSLANKGLRREAIALWRSRADICGKPLWEGPYLNWLIDEGQIADVLNYLTTQYSLRRLPDTANDANNTNDAAAVAQLALVEAQLAPALLTADTHDDLGLPAESPLLRHRAAALAALTAYSQQDAAALEAALASIPFRSPYRDLRVILKAMVLHENDAAAASDALARLPINGPFERLAAPLRLPDGANPAFLDSARLRYLTSSLTAPQQELALELLGCPTALRPLLHACSARLNSTPPPSPSELFDLILHHAKSLPDELATRCWRRLSPWAKRSGCTSPKLFGHPTPTDEEAATALMIEAKGELSHAETHWLNAIKPLKEHLSNEDKLRAALILRHLAQAPNHLSRDGVLDERGAKLLAMSLAYDMQEIGTHLSLIQYWRHQGDLKKARAYLDQGLTSFPDNVAMLMEAVETALASAAFKKAAVTAQRLLALDPLNAKVRQLIGNAHLSHAAKQIAANKPAAAGKEINEAETWLNDPVARGRMLAMRALTVPAGSTEQTRLMREAARCWGSGLVAGWRLLREAGSMMGITKPAAGLALLAEAGITPEQTASPADILQLLPVLEDTPQLARKPKGLEPLAPWRKAIIKQATTLTQEMATAIRLCEAFSKHHDNDVVEALANAALKHWPQRPVFVYHGVAARFNKAGSIVSERDFSTLQDAHDAARQEKDAKLTIRINDLLDADEATDASSGDWNGDLSGNPFGGNPFDFGRTMVRAALQVEIQRGGEKKFINKVRGFFGAARVSQIENETGTNRKLFLERLIDLMLQSIEDGDFNDDGFGTPGNLPPFIPAKVVKPETAKAKSMINPAPAAPLPATLPKPTAPSGQKSLFDD